MTAKEFLKQKGIHPTELIYWDLENTRILLDELMQEYHESEVKKLNISVVSKAKRSVKRSSNATAYNDGYCKGYEDALVDTGKSV